MNPNHVVSSCFKALQACHLSRPVDSPRSPSSVVLSDDIHQESNMLAVTEHWILDDDVLLPTKQHLQDYCRSVATRLPGDRVICFSCDCPQSSESYSVSVHLSRIKTHGGKLMKLVMPHISKSSDRLVRMQVQESVLGMLAISDYLYRSQIDFAAASVSDAIEIASAAWKWECHDLFFGSLMYIVSNLLFDRQVSIRASLSFQWLSRAPSSFIAYFCTRLNLILPLCSLSQMVDVLHWTYITSKVRLRNRILQYIVLHDSVRTDCDARLLLTFYRRLSVPTEFKVYFAIVMARFFFLLFAEGRAFEIDTAARECMGATGEQFIEPVLSSHLPKKDFIGLLHRNNILYETLKRINQGSSSNYDARSIFWTILYHAEPMIHDKNKVILLVQRVCAAAEDPELLLSDDTAWTRLSPRGMRIVALAFFSRRSYCSSIQFSIHIHWDFVRTGVSMRSAVGSVAGVKFELKARSTGTGSCSWRLYYSNVEGCLKPETSLEAIISYELFNSKCCCEDVHVMERRTKVKFEDKSFHNGSLKDLHTEGEVTILNEGECEEWCSRHQKSCILSICIRVEL